MDYLRNGTIISATIVVAATLAVLKHSNGDFVVMNITKNTSLGVYSTYAEARDAMMSLRR